MKTRKTINSSSECEKLLNVLKYHYLLYMEAAVIIVCIQLLLSGNVVVTPDCVTLLGY